MSEYSKREETQCSRSSPPATLYSKKTMVDKIKKLEKISSKLELKQQKRMDWTNTVQEYITDFLDDFNPNTTFQVSKDMGKGILDVPIEENGKSLESILQVLKDNVDTPNLNPASGGHLGYIAGGGVYTSALADYMAAATNRFTGIFYACPGGVRMENYLLRWMCQMVGYPDTALGNISSGGSIANLSAITTARDVKKIKARDIEYCVIYLTQEVHHCVQKAFRIAGMQESTIRYIPMDREYRMDTSFLLEQIQKDKQAGLKPFMVIGSAGTTNTGAVDPLEDIGNIAKEYDLWFHVDAAYGGFFLLCPEMKAIFKGIELSDSIAIDPHKGLFLSYGIGALLVKDVQALYNTHHYTAGYMQDSFNLHDDPAPSDLSPELTRHFRGLRMWLSLQLFGVAPFRAALEEKVLLCRYFYDKIQQLGFEVGTYPQLSIAIFRYVPQNGEANAFNDQLVEAFKKDGRLFLSSTTLDGKYWIRFAVCSFRTHMAQIALALELLEGMVLEMDRS